MEGLPAGGRLEGPQSEPLACTPGLGGYRHAGWAALGYSPTVGVLHSGDRARVGSVGTMWGRSLRTGARRRARDWYMRCPGSHRTAMPDGRSRVGRVVARAGRCRRRGTAYSRMRVYVPCGTAEHLGSTLLGLRLATARVAGGTRVTAGGSPAIRAQHASGQRVAGERDCGQTSTGHCRGTASGPLAWEGLRSTPAGLVLFAGHRASLSPA